MWRTVQKWVIRMVCRVGRFKKSIFLVFCCKTFISSLQWTVFWNQTRLSNNCRILCCCDEVNQSFTSQLYGAYWEQYCNNMLHRTRALMSDVLMMGYECEQRERKRQTEQLCLWTMMHSEPWKESSELLLCRKSKKLQLDRESLRERSDVVCLPLVVWAALVFFYSSSVKGCNRSFVSTVLRQINRI